MKYNIKVGERWLIGESATETIKGTVRGDTTAVFSRMVGEMSAYDFADNKQEAASFDRITLCDYLRGIVERQNYGHYLGEIKVIPEDQEEAEAQLPKRVEVVRCGECKYHLPETERTNPYCNRFHCMKPDDWFCADGEREVQDGQK